MSQLPYLRHILHDFIILKSQIRIFYTSIFLTEISTGSNGIFRYSAYKYFILLVYRNQTKNFFSDCPS